MKIISWYWVLPIISGVAWLATLLGLLLYWILVADEVVYPSMEPGQDIAYISDVGASRLKPLFVVGCIITTVFLDLSFAADRWLRHKGRLAPNVSIWEKIFFGLSIAFAVVGTVGLTCLSGFDTAHYPHQHDLFLGLFIGGYLLSAIFICAEFQRLGKKYRQHRCLTISFWIKFAFIWIEVALLIAFGVALQQERYDVSAPLEWTISFIFSFYVFSFVVDLLPASQRGSPPDPYALRPMTTHEAREMRQQGRSALPGGASFDDGRDTEDSQRTLAAADGSYRTPYATPKPQTDPRDF